MNKAMKKAGFALAFLFLVHAAQAQTWSEWMRQKKTQIKYLLQQIAALQVYAGYVNEGYGIAKDGLHTVQQLKKGDFDLHDEHFASLRTVNPNVSGNPEAKEVRALNDAVISLAGKSYGKAAASTWLTEEEKRYVQKVYANLIAACKQQTEALHNVLSDNASTATDAEREERISAISQDVSDKYRFARSFSNGLSVLTLQRGKEEKDVKNVQRLYGSKK